MDIKKSSYEGAYCIISKDNLKEFSYVFVTYFEHKNKRCMHRITIVHGK